MKKRFLCVLLILCMVVNLLPPLQTDAATVATSGTCGDNLTWTLTEDGTLTISGTGIMPDYSNDDVPWLDYRGSIVTVVIEAGATNIGEYAFYMCYNLTSVTIPDSVTDIGLSAFENCTSLPTIKIGDKVTIVDDWAFYACSSLTSVTLGNGVTNIGNGAFWGCSSLNNVVIPDSVTSIEGFAFYECTNLNSATIGKNVASIGQSAFADCSSLTSITIPASASSTGFHAFGYCTNLVSVTIEEGVTTIDKHSFSNCTKLTSITIPDSVTSIGQNAFNGCGTLTEIMFAGDAPSIADDAFNGVTATAYYPSNNDTWTNEIKANHGGSLTWIVYEGENVIASGSCGEEQTWTLTFDGVLTISGTGTMDDYSLGQVAPPWTPYRDDISIVVIKSEVTNISNQAFITCNNLTAITVESENRYYSSADGVLFDKEMTLLHTYPAEKSGEYTVPNQVECIDSHAFYCILGSELTSVTLPDSVTYIGAGAFKNCSSLTSVKLSGSVTNIQDDTFYGCSSLTSAVIPDNVTSIGYNAFNSCTDLKSVTLGTGLTSIRAGAFQNCANLASVAIPAGVTSIGPAAFLCANMTGIWVDENNPCYSSDHNGVLFNKEKTELLQAPGGLSGNYTISNSVTSINGCAFYECRNLTSVVIPDSVVSIGDGAFFWCSSLTAITIPNSVTSIGDVAFLNASSLTEIKFAGNAPSIMEGTFSGVTATAYYPSNNSTWTDEVKADYGGTLTWIAYESSEINVDALDINSDGKVSVFDAQILLEVEKGLRTLSEEQQSVIGDLTAQDIVDYILGRA